jgi:hypothetical protein
MSALMMLLGKGKGKKPEETEEMDSEEDSSDSLVAAEAILDAIAKKDAKLLDEALRSHRTLCE